MLQLFEEPIIQNLTSGYTPVASIHQSAQVTETRGMVWELRKKVVSETFVAQTNLDAIKWLQRKKGHKPGSNLKLLQWARQQKVRDAHLTFSQPC